MAAIRARPSAPVISAAANAAGTMGALGCSEADACVSSKSSEWASVPFSIAAPGGA
jgi:hypothetical protein